MLLLVIIAILVFWIVSSRKRKQRAAARKSKNYPPNDEILEKETLPLIVQFTPKVEMAKSIQTLERLSKSNSISGMSVRRNEAKLFSNLQSSDSMEYIDSCESSLDRNHGGSTQVDNSTIDIQLSDDAVYKVYPDSKAIEEGLETLKTGLAKLDNGLHNLDVGLSRLATISRTLKGRKPNQNGEIVINFDDVDDLNRLDLLESARAIGDAFREQLTNPPQGWDLKSVKSFASYQSQLEEKDQ